MDQPTDNQIARLRAQGDQLRSYIRDFVLGMKPADLAKVIKMLTMGKLQGLTKEETAVVAWMASVTILDVLDQRDRDLATELPEDELIRVLIGTVCAFPNGATAEQIYNKLLAEGNAVTLQGIAARLARLARQGRINEDRPGIYEGP